MYRRIAAAYEAFRGEPVRDSIRLAAPPSEAPGPAGARTRAAVESVGSLDLDKRLERIPLDRMRWLRVDVEDAKHRANQGDLFRAAQIAQWVKEDLVDGGLMLTRCSVPRLPREWRGDDEARIWLQGEGRSPGVFDRILPPGEIEELCIDHLDLGVGIGCFIQPAGAKYPRLVRLDNQGLRYIPGQNRWQYQGFGKTYDVTPGDGVWVLNANGYSDPWREGLWIGLGNDLVSAAGSTLARDAFVHRFALPMLLAKYPGGASEPQKLSFFESVAGGIMSVIGVTPGYSVDLVQARAEGAQVFKDSEERQERRAAIAICGTSGIMDGGAGFANGALFQQVKDHLVHRTGQDAASFINDQALPAVLAWAARAGHLSRRDRELVLAYDTTPPQARESEAKAIEAAMRAFVAQLEAAERAGDPMLRPNAAEYRARFRLPTTANKLGAALAAIEALSGDERAALLSQLHAPANDARAPEVEARDAA